MNDKMYPVRLNKEKLDVVLKHCKNKKTSFSKKVRGLMEEIYEEYLIEDQLGRQEIADSYLKTKAVFDELKVRRAMLGLLKEESDEKEM